LYNRFDNRLYRVNGALHTVTSSRRQSVDRRRAAIDVVFFCGMLHLLMLRETDRERENGERELSQLNCFYDAHAGD